MEEKNPARHGLGSHYLFSCGHVSFDGAGNLKRLLLRKGLCCTVLNPYIHIMLLSDRLMPILNIWVCQFIKLAIWSGPPPVRFNLDKYWFDYLLSCGSPIVHHRRTTFGHRRPTTWPERKKIHQSKCVIICWPDSHVKTHTHTQTKKPPLLSLVACRHVTTAAVVPWGRRLPNIFPNKFRWETVADHLNTVQTRH